MDDVLKDQPKPNSSYQKSLLRMSRGVWWVILLQTTFYTFYGLPLFMTAELPTHAVVPSVLFTLLGVFTFLYGTRFFRNYTQFRETKIMALEGKRRREAVLTAVVLQLLLVQFICILGIVLSIFQQRIYYVYPFFAAFAVAMWMSYPRNEWFNHYFGETHAKNT